MERTRYAVAGWGEGELRMDDGIVLAHDFEFGASTAGLGEAGGDEVLTGRGEAEDLVARFRLFLAGRPVVFDDVALELEPFTGFQRDVARVLRSIPRGEVVAYGELAALAGRPGAARAVGTFCARNPFAFLLPCHRVVGADGIGGYGSAGVGVKRRLLALEGLSL